MSWRVFLWQSCLNLFSNCTSENIMMDATVLYPRSWHPLRINTLPGFTHIFEAKKAPHYTRTSRPVKYYLINYRSSRRYRYEEMPPNEPIVMGGDKSVPEHFSDKLGSCDPFPTDIYCLGNLIKEHLLRVSNTEFD